MSKRQPEWFCGDAKEWDSINHMLSLKEDLHKLKDQSARYYIAKHSKQFLAGAISHTVIACGVIGGLLFKHPIGILSLMSWPVSLMFLDIVGNGMSNTEIDKRCMDIEAKKLSKLSKSLQVFGNEKLEKFSKALRAVGDHMKHNQGAHFDNEPYEIAVQLDELSEIAKKGFQESSRSILESAKAIGEETMRETPSIETPSPARLYESLKSKLGTLGSDDGIAAVIILEGILNDPNADERVKRESKSLLTENLPKLISAFEAVPLNDRDKPSEFLDGISARASFSRGVIAAMERSFGLRKEMTELARLRVEQEARVLEERNIKAGF